MDDGSNCIDRPPPVPGVFSGVALRRRHEKGNQHGITRCPAAFLRAAIHRRTLSSSLLPCFASREKPRSVECGVSAVLVVGMLDCLRAMNDEKIIDRERALRALQAALRRRPAAQSLRRFTLTLAQSPAAASRSEKTK